MRFIDLMGGQKPHLLIRAANNLGAETRLQYAPSTKFYVTDRLEGKPWVTRLPFPVQVVERAETHDLISGNRFVTRYAYHHGYFDGTEREFRGFGLVEQWDTEELSALSGGQLPAGTNFDVASHVPPVLTRTWFHTGAYVDGDHISNFFAGLVDNSDRGEYYREPGLTDAQAAPLLLDDTTLPAGLTADEEREACRALKGSMLRQEVYAVAGSAREPHPYTVTEQNFTIRRLQAQSPNRHAVFFAHARESLTYQYERNPADPRILHTLTLEVDDFGNVLKSAAVGYGRRQPDPTLEPRDWAKQGQVLITYGESDFTNAVESVDDYRAPLPCEARSYEITGLPVPAGNRRFTLAELTTAGAAAALLGYEQAPTAGLLQKRRIEQLRTLYRRNNLSGALPLGQLQSLAVPFESYRLALTAGIVAEVFAGRVTDSMLETEGRYLHSEGDADWWVRSGRTFYSADATHSPAQELAYARQHFFLPVRYRDAFHTNSISAETVVRYDPYDLLLEETLDPLGNRVTVGQRHVDPTQPLVSPGQDYRLLRPVLMMDPNRNQAAVAVDILGMVVGTAIAGKPEESPIPGDSLAGFDADLTQQQIDVFFSAADPHTEAPALLGTATSRIIYDVDRFRRTRAVNPQDSKLWEPAFAATLERETHASVPLAADGLRIQITFSYSDGFGREVQKKAQAEQGPAPQRDPLTGGIVLVNGQPSLTGTVGPRWICSGWTVFNNKGKPVRRYEPFFTDRHAFELDVPAGVSAILFYDPATRVVGTLRPNHTWEKAVLDAWRQEAWDVNDTVAVADPKTDPDVGEFFRRLPEGDYLPTWSAQRQGGALGAQEAAVARDVRIHATTPTIMHLDSLGRPFLTLVYNRFKYSTAAPTDPPTDELYATRQMMDITGNRLRVTDAKDRLAMQYHYDLLGNNIHQVSIDAGERWILSDAAGNAIRAWDGNGHELRSTYDVLHRPRETFVAAAAGVELLAGSAVYGESQIGAEATNLRGQVVQLFDQAGVVTNGEYDFKGNLVRSERQFATEYKNPVDWSATVPLDAARYPNLTSVDALNRPVEQIPPDGSIIRWAYSEANLLDRIDVNLRGAADPTSFVSRVAYNAKGQRMSIAYGNGVTTTYEYDPLTFRLVALTTSRNPSTFLDDCPQQPQPGWPGCYVQNLVYTYDPTGNVAFVRDAAQQAIFFNNRRVEPSNAYRYDALYRLIEATGREHLGQISGQPNGPTRAEPFDVVHTRLDHPSDGGAMGTYLERYFYDAVGNILAMQHRGSDPAHSGWKRCYQYAVDSNRLLSTGGPADPLNSDSQCGSSYGPAPLFPDQYEYDADGNMTRMPHLPIMLWNHRDQLAASARQVRGADLTPETTYYVYNGAGERVRKITELANGSLKDDRIYVGAFELYSSFGSNSVRRETLHVMDEDGGRIAMVDTKTAEGGSFNTLRRLSSRPEALIRYQVSNHLGSCTLELDDQANVISYEEFTPFGSTSFEAVRNQVEDVKRYRYLSKERDGENGLDYCGARYYASWLGRWTSADPKGMVDGPNLYEYVRGNPIRLRDPSGTGPVDDVIKRIQESTARARKTAERVNGLSQEIENATQVYEKTLPEWENLSTYSSHPETEQLLVKQSQELGQKVEQSSATLQQAERELASLKESIPRHVEELRGLGVQYEDLLYQNLGEASEANILASDEIHTALYQAEKHLDAAEEQVLVLSVDAPQAAKLARLGKPLGEPGFGLWASAGRRILGVGALLLLGSLVDTSATLGAGGEIEYDSGALSEPAHFLDAADSQVSYLFTGEGVRPATLDPNRKSPDLMIALGSGAGYGLIGGWFGAIIGAAVGLIGYVAVEGDWVGDLSASYTEQLTSAAQAWEQKLNRPL